VFDNSLAQQYFSCRRKRAFIFPILGDIWMKSGVKLIAFICIAGIAGCSAARPVLYSNEHLRTIGPEMARRDIAECQSLAEAAGSSPNQSKGGEVARNTIGGGAVGAATGAVGGAVVGSAGSGSAIGAASGAAAGLLRGLFSRSEPNQVYVAFVNQCLQERGYEVVGWE
jgi:hypothetical protein